MIGSKFLSDAAKLLKSFDSKFYNVALIVLFSLSVAAVRGCMLMEFPTWAGLLSLTFGSTFILVGAFHSSGFYGWAVAKELVLTNKNIINKSPFNYRRGSYLFN